MKILVSNDDGVDSTGIRLLAEALKPLGEVTVVAPLRERSTSGHSLTLHKPLRIHDLGGGIYATSGTPADCIYLGLREILKGLPDIIVSGINRGANLGTDIHYSGTVAAAREGALMNIPSYAFSLVTSPFPAGVKKHRHFEVAATIAREVVEWSKGFKFPSHTLLNVNIPDRPRGEIKGIRVAEQGFRYYSNEVDKRTDPRGREYFWIGGSYVGFEKGENSDCAVVEEGYVSIAPLTIDCTHKKFYATLKEQTPPSI